MCANNLPPLQEEERWEESEPFWVSLSLLATKYYGRASVLQFKGNLSWLCADDFFKHWLNPPCAWRRETNCHKTTLLLCRITSILCYTESGFRISCTCCTNVKISPRRTDQSTTSRSPDFADYLDWWLTFYDNSNEIAFPICNRKSTKNIVKWTFVISIYFWQETFCWS